MRILVNSIPKAGTHLLKKCISLFPGLVDAEVHVDTGLSFRELQESLSGVPEQAIATGHLPGYPKIIGLVDELGFKALNILRDPRDTVVSFMLYVMAQKGHPLHDQFAELADDDTRLMTTIKGVRTDQREKSLLDIGSLYRSFEGWYQVENGLLVKFEDLVGSAGGGNPSVQTEQINHISRFLGVHLSQHDRDQIADRVFDPSSPTFRKGQIGEWRRYFKPEHCIAFYQSAGHLLLELGYEENDDWLDSVAAGLASIAQANSEIMASMGQVRLLDLDDILHSFDIIERQLPRILPVTIWQAWELAACSRHELARPIVALGTGGERILYGLDPSLNEQTEQRAKIRIGRADIGVTVLGGGAGFDRQQYIGEGSSHSLFAYRWLERSTIDIGEAFRELYRITQTGGVLIIAALTDEFETLARSDIFTALFGGKRRSNRIWRNYKSFHGIERLLTVTEMVDRAAEAGFELVEHVPIMPRALCAFSLFVDILWHNPTEAGEFGGAMHLYLRRVRDYPQIAKDVLRAIYRIDSDMARACGAVLSLKKVG